MPLVPRIENGYVMIPILTFIVVIPCYYCANILISCMIGTTVIHMFENIPDVSYVAVFIVGVTLLIALLASHSSYIENKKDEEIKKKKALMTGEKYDVDQVTISSTYSWIFALFAVFGAIIASVAVIVAIDAVIPYIFKGSTVAPPALISLVGAAVAAVVYMALDKYLMRPAAMGAFYTTVEQPLVKAVTDKCESAIKANGNSVNGNEALGSAIGIAIANALAEHSKKV